LRNPAASVTEPVGAGLVAVEGVTALTVCHQPAAMMGDRRLQPGQPAFERLVSALARPNDRSTGGACPAYPDGLIQVIAQTAHGDYWLEVPHDARGHYLRRPVDRLVVAFG
jgi:hypothetical protein